MIFKYCMFFIELFGSIFYCLKHGGKGMSEVNLTSWLETLDKDFMNRPESDNENNDDSSHEEEKNE